MGLYNYLVWINKEKEKKKENLLGNIWSRRRRIELFVISWKQHADEKNSFTRKNSIDTDVFTVLIQKTRLNIFQVVSIR